MPLTGAIPEGPSLFCPAALGCAFEPQTHSSADSGMPHAAGAVPTEFVAYSGRIPSWRPAGHGRAKYHVTTLIFSPRT